MTFGLVSYQTEGGIVDTVEKLRGFIAGELYKGGTPEELTPDYPLFEHQIIDSLGLLVLISFMEEQFGVVFEDDELTPGNFATIGAMAGLIERKRVPVDGPA